MTTETLPLVHLLWTGGWDSTFRLLDLLHRTSAIVQPWYIIDEARRSTGTEIRTMWEIRQAVHQRDSKRAERIRATRFKGLGEIARAPDTTAKYKGIQRRMPIGAQYHWLPQFAGEMGIPDLELSVHAGIQGRAQGFVAAIADDAERVETPYGPTYRLVAHPSDTDLELFRPFSFPLLESSKLDMMQVAEDAGFTDLMRLTWFCHRPRGRTACGRCYPCQQVLQEGMGFRMPLPSRVLGRLRLFRRGIAKMVYKVRIP